MAGQRGDFWREIYRSRYYNKKKNKRLSDILHVIGATFAIVPHPARTIRATFYCVESSDWPNLNSIDVFFFFHIQSIRFPMSYNEKSIFTST